MAEKISTNEEANIKEDKLWGLYLLLLLVAILWLGSIFIFQYYYPDLEDRSLFGGSFNAISSLFSGLAFAGVIYAILLQRKELQLQRKELRETRKVLAKTARAQESSAEQFTRQSNNMKISAKLNALNTLVNYCIEIEKHDFERGSARLDARREKEIYIKQIKEILNDK